MTDLGTYDNSIVTLEEVVKVFPNFGALHPQTKIQAYREFKPMRDTVELTLFYREPGQEKMRLDAEISGNFLTTGDEVEPQHVKITFVGPAITAIAAADAIAGRAA